MKNILLVFSPRKAKKVLVFYRFHFQSKETSRREQWQIMKYLPAWSKADRQTEKKQNGGSWRSEQKQESSSLMLAFCKTFLTKWKKKSQKKN